MIAILDLIVLPVAFFIGESSSSSEVIKAGLFLIGDDDCSDPACSPLLVVLLLLLGDEEDPEDVARERTLEAVLEKKDLEKKCIKSLRILRRLLKRPIFTSIDSIQCVFCTHVILLCADIAIPTKGLSLNLDQPYFCNKVPMSRSTYGVNQPCYSTKLRKFVL